MVLKLKLQYFGHLIWRADSFEKTLMLGKIEGRRRRGQQRMGWLDGITARWTWVWVDSGSWWWTGRPGVLWFTGSQRVGHDWATELNWTYTLAPLQFSFKTTPSMIQPICELDHASILLRTIQWFLFYFWIKYRSLTVAYKDIHILALSLVSVPPLSPCSSCKCLLVLTISQTPFKFLLLERSLS